MLMTKELARRMIAESVVIVASILLAFALDAWWDSVQRKREVAATLVALDAEFAEVETELERAQTRSQLVVAAADTILSLLRAGQGSVPAQRLGDLFRTPTTTPAQGALAALIASGRLGMIPSQELQALLAGWPALLEDVKEDEENALRFVFEELLVHLSHVEGLGPTLYGRQGVQVEGSVLLPTTSETINLVEARRLFATIILDEHERLEIREVVGQIRRSVQIYLY
jgi:hypothetical protein